jgi:hypothetical protein
VTTPNRDLSSRQPLDGTQMAVLFRQVQWTLDDAAYDWPAGRITPERREELARTLESLAILVREDGSQHGRGVVIDAK